jgi:hypothetical protein
MRQHNCFSKLRIGDIVIEKFEVLDIDRNNKEAKLKDLQDPKSKFWISAIYINEPELFDEMNECL